MAGEGGENPISQSETGQNGPENSPKKEFPKSVVLKDQSELDAIQNPDLRNDILTLHTVGKTYTRGDWFAAQKMLAENTLNKKYPFEESGPFLGRIVDHIEKEDEKARAQAKKPESDTPLRDEMLKRGKPLLAAAAGAALGVGGAEVVEELGKNTLGAVFKAVRMPGETAVKWIRRKAAQSSKASMSRQESSSGVNAGGPKEKSQSKEKKAFSEMTYTELLRKRRDPNLSADQKDQINEEIEGLVTTFFDYRIDNDRYVDKLRDKAFDAVKFNPWDKVYTALVRVGEEEERHLRQSSGDNPRWEGIVRSTLNAEAARVVLSGIQNKIKSDAKGYTEQWKEKNNATDEQRARFQDQVSDGVFQLLPDRTEHLVGSELPETEASYAKLKAGGASATVGSPDALERVANATERTAKRLEQEEPEIENLEPAENTPEGWARMVLSNLDKAEQESNKSGKVSSEDGKTWAAIDKALEKMGKFGTPDQLLSEYYKTTYPEGVYLKEKLRLYFEARKRLNDRYIEIKIANGSLPAMGLGSEDIQFKNLKYTVQEIEPMDWWVLINGDTVLESDLAGLTPSESKELLPDVDKGLTQWWNAGTLNYEVYRKALNSADAMARIRSSIATSVDSIKSEDLANRILTASLSMALFDKDRESFQGKSDDRDLIWFDRKRAEDFGKKEREPGVDWTIGRYFARPGQAEEFIPEPGRNERLPAKIAKRKQTLKINSERSVFIESGNFIKGEIVGDFFNTATVYVPDSLKSGDYIARKLISFAVNRDGTAIPGGWRDIPFYNLGPQTYTGYFGYSLGIGGAVVKELNSMTWNKPEEIKSPDFWESKRGLFGRLGTISPWFNSAEFEVRGKLIREKLIEYGGFDSAEIGKIGGYSNEEDLSVITDDRQRRRAVNFINAEGRRISREAKKLATEYTQNLIHKLRMVYALGVVWPGSLHAVEDVAGVLGSSSLNTSDIAAVVKSIAAARFLENKYLEQFKYEALNEMGFGPAMASGRKKRY